MTSAADPHALLAPRDGRGGQLPGVQRPTGVVVVDPIPLFLEGLAALAARTPAIRILGATANLNVAVGLVERYRPDVVLVDAVLDPRCHFGRLLSGANTPAESLDAPAVLSLLRDPLRSSQYLANAVNSGITGFVLRSAEPAGIVTAIRRLHAERHYLDPDLAPLSGGLGLRSVTGARQPLSRREYQVLQLISEGMENQEIARALFVSTETVRTHVKSILRKLHARDRAHAVAVGFRLGVLAVHRSASPVASAPAPPPVTRVGAPRPSGHGHVGGQSLARVTSR